MMIEVKSYDKFISSERVPEKLNVLMVTARYFPYVGGIETHVHEVGRRLAARGVNITILTTFPHFADSSLPYEEKINGVRIVRVKAWPSQRDYYIAPEIIKIIKQGTWNLIHCQGCHTFVPPMAMLAAQQAKFPYIVTFHTGGHSSEFRNKIRGAQWHLLRPLLVGASQLIGVSHYEANYFRDLLHLPPDKFMVIPNGSTLPISSQLPSDEVNPERTLIVSVGRLERYKGHQRLIKALPEILKWRPDARLLIVGSGPYETTLRQLAQDCGVAEYVEIRAIPANARQLMAETMAQASLIALLSEYEAHPIAVMEALSLHRPVLVTKTSGLQELAEQGLVRSIPLNSSPEEVALAVQQQIEEPISPPTDFVLPTWDDCTSQLYSVYTKLLRKD